MWCRRPSGCCWCSTFGVAELDDPRGLCRDISNIGRWGNGDVEVGLSSLDELPYVMGLIRQALDRQMGGPQDDEY